MNNKKYKTFIKQNKYIKIKKQIFNSNFYRTNGGYLFHMVLLNSRSINNLKTKIEYRNTSIEHQYY